MPSFRIQHCDLGSNRDELRINLDLLEGLRDEASVRIVAQKKCSPLFQQKSQAEAIECGRLGAKEPRSYREMRRSGKVILQLGRTLLYHGGD